MAPYHRCWRPDSGRHAADHRVEGSFQYLVNSWTTIVSLISIYKRLRAFEALMRDEPLDVIEAEVMPRQL